MENRISRDVMMEEDYLCDCIRKVYEEEYDEHPSDAEIWWEIAEHRMYEDMGTGETLWGKYQITPSYVKCMNCGYRFPDEKRYHGSMGGDFCSENCYDEYLEDFTNND